MSFSRRAADRTRAILGDRAFQGLVCLLALAFCGFAWHSCSQARDEAAAVRVANEAQNAILEQQRVLLEALAGLSSRPLVRRYHDARGAEVVVTTPQLPGEPFADQARRHAADVDFMRTLVPEGPTESGK